jgi:(p)ppGpp synthase/HD superfamily hydrolase
MNDVAMTTRAAYFAALTHTGQTRKGAAKEPYINHLAEVAALVADATHGRDANLVIAAWLHDAVEDRGITREEIASSFGEDVADVVLEVTDDKSLPKEKRKRLQVETVAGKSPRARLLKLADKTSNVGAVVESPPTDWSKEQLQAYVRWAVEVVDAGCRGLDEELERRFDMAASKVL